MYNFFVSKCGFRWRKERRITKSDFYSLSAQRIANIEASVSKHQPVSKRNYDFSNKKLFTKCGQYKGTPPTASSVVITCPREIVGQYVYIHTAALQYLEFCEVAVYKSKFAVLIWLHDDISIGSLWCVNIAQSFWCVNLVNHNNKYCLTECITAVPPVWWQLRYCGFSLKIVW